MGLIKINVWHNISEWRKCRGRLAVSEAIKDMHVREGKTPDGKKIVRITPYDVGEYLREHK